MPRALLNPTSTEACPSNAWILEFDPPLRDDACPVNAGPLAGLSFAVKDNIDVAGQPTTAGCPSFVRAPKASATVVQKLLQSGASLIGKTNLDQFACGLSGTRSPYGPVPNAFDPSYVSGGSSSGSGYVVATGQVDFALGTDTAGSGRVPAGLNNIVGFKPSRGRISAAGVVPAAQSVDVVSIFARSVPMAWRVLQSAAGFDPLDPYSRGGRELPWRTAPFPARPRIGVPESLEFFGDTQACAAFEQALGRLTAMGAHIVPIDYRPLASVAALLYDSALVAERHAAIRDFFDAHENQVIEPVRSIIGAGRRYSASEVFAAQLSLQQLAAKVRPLWGQIDVLVVPTAPTHVPLRSMLADPVELNRRLGYYTNFVNLLDYAAVSVPSSIRPDGLPFGITFIGQAGSDWPLADIGTRYHARAYQDNALPQGALDLPLGADDLTPPPPPAASLTLASEVELAVVGAHLSGMPLNVQLIERGARLLRATRTAPLYRLYALPGSVPPKPGLVRVDEAHGSSIEIEVWAMPVEHYGSFVALIPAPLGIGRLRLADGSEVQGFLCESHAVQAAADITHHGGWRDYMAKRPQPRSPAGHSD